MVTRRAPGSLGARASCPLLRTIGGATAGETSALLVGGHLHRERLRVKNPASGAALAVRVRFLGGGRSKSALVLVAGGLASGDLYFGASGIAERYARRGYVVVDFDPDGRGESAGSEDYNGFVHQDGLAAVIQAAAKLPGVDAQRMALVSFCYGATMAAGALARHPQLPVRLFVDWEGLPLREHVRRASASKGWQLPVEEMDELWWRQREAAILVRAVAVPYQRVQGCPDHLEPDATRALAMVRGATSREYGGEGISPWTRINGNPPNQLYSPAAPPTWLPQLPAEVALLPYLVELLPPI